METTVEIDEAKLKRVMELTHSSSPGRTIDIALEELERTAKLNKLLSEPFYVTSTGPVIDPNYDLQQMREREKPAS